MKKVFLDSNIFLRFFVPEADQSFQETLQLLSAIDQGLYLPYTSNIVFLECFYVLTSFYKFPKQKVRDALDEIAAIRNMTIVEKGDIREALILWRKTNVKFTDCLIATQVGNGITLATYDREFRKLPGLVVAEPGEVLKNIQKI